MSASGRRPPAPVRRPASRRPGGAPDEGQQAQQPQQGQPEVRLPATGPAARRPPQPAHPPAPLTDPGPEAQGRAPARSGRATAAPRPARSGRPWRRRADPVPSASGGVTAGEQGPPARRRPRPRVVVAVVLGAVVVLAVLAWALLVSSLTGLREVTVQGADRTDASAVQQAAADQLGLPLLRVDTGAVARRTEELPWVASVDVQLRPPHGLRVVVVERTASAAVPAPEGAPGVVLLDDAGQEITTADAAPEGVPLVQVDVAAAGPDAVGAASDVALALPASLREQVASITATGPDDVRLALRSGQEVRWGAPGDDDLKARVVALLLPREGVSRVDVSAPLAPATS